MAAADLHAGHDGEAARRCIAVDWSGARDDGAQRKKIRIAESSGGVTRLVRSAHRSGGFTRGEAVEWLLGHVAAQERAVVGLDFAFSFPLGFVRTMGGVHDVADVWRRAAHEGRGWLRCETSPFWGREPRRQRTTTAGLHRRTEEEVGVVARRRPASVFLLCGAQQVGPGSILGMPHLLALRERGFAVWPFDGGWPRIVEIWPTLHTRLPNKQRAQRERWLREHAGVAGAPAIDDRSAADALASDDAFDALASAHDLALHAGQLGALRQTRDPVERLEGAIFVPDAARRHHRDRLPSR